MDTNTPSQKHWSWTFTPVVMLTIISVFALIAAIVTKDSEGDGDKTVYALLLLMPCVIVALLVEVFLRILLRKAIKYKTVYLWAIEIIAIVLIFVIFLNA